MKAGGEKGVLRSQDFCLKIQLEAIKRNMESRSWPIEKHLGIALLFYNLIYNKDTAMYIESCRVEAEVHSQRTISLPCRHRKALFFKPVVSVHG